MANIRTYEGAVALVTGAASGIGRALATDLASRGATVVLADLQEELANEVAASIRKDGGRASAHPLDVRDAEGFDALVDEVMEREGRLDYLFNNAGIVVIGPFRRMSLDEHKRLLEVNINGVLHGIAATYERMCDQGFGHIVNTASISAFVMAPWFATYGATKHAVLGLTKNLRFEARYEGTGVRVSAICPGLINTAMVQGGRYGTMYVDLPDEQKVQRMLMSPEVLARKALDQVARDKGVIVVPGWWRVMQILSLLIPGFEVQLSRLLMKQGLMQEKG